MKNNQREIFGWVMYDWANSAFGSTVLTTLMAPYLTRLIDAQGGTIGIFGYPVESAAFYPACVFISVFLQVILLPVLGTIADYSPLKKKLMLFFAYTGAIATALLFFVTSGSILLGGLLFIIANLSFGAAIVFYNAFLPDIVGPDRRDAVSSQGFAYGYFGGGVLLAVNLGVLWLMREQQDLAIRLSLSSAGIWWLVFTLIYPQRRLIQRPPELSLPPQANYITHGLKEFIASLREMKNKYPKTMRYLIGYLIYNDGIQTVIWASGIFATTELDISPLTLALVILVIQFVASFGSVLFDLVARRLGAKRTIILNLFIWSGLLIYAYLFLFNLTQFWILSIGIGLVLGSSQALSRSLFSQMVPASRESAYFGLYEISDRATSLLGPFAFGLAVQMTGSSRIALLPIITFFLIGIVILSLTDVRAAIREAGNEVPTVV